jgi:alkylation response protein AidB-like acyl-CoA dehydrogenase
MAAQRSFEIDPVPYSLPPRREIDFLLFDWLGADALVDRDLADGMLDLSERLAAEHFLPHYKQADVEEPVLDADGQVRLCPAVGDALRRYADLGLFSAGFSEALGGFGFPFLLCSASFTYFAAANIATSAYSMLTVANARLIAAHGTPRQIEHFARPQIAGRWFGTMCLSEPQAGSNLADIRTRAVREGADELGERYRIVGNKMWISGGDQDASENIVHLVLAKIPDEDGRLADGTAGISLFIVPKLLPDGARNDIRVAGLNHKMGYRGTANCLLNFGEAEGAIGWLVGKPGDGLRQMFLMMNEARINVGLGAAALACRSYRLSSRYAHERVQGRPAGRGQGASVPIVEHADVRRMLLAQRAYAEGALALSFYCAKLCDEEADPARASLLGLLIPVAKTWPSEYGLAANDIAIQIHGGYGYTRDFHVEQLWRDNRLNPIHEGTTGIQAADLIDRKILRDGRGLAVLEAELAATMDRARCHPALAGCADGLADAWRRIARCIAALRDGAPDRTCDNAVPFLSAFGHLVVGWIWLDQAAAAAAIPPSGPDSDALRDGKLLVCRYFFDAELPKITAWADLVTARNDVAATAPVHLL